MSTFTVTIGWSGPIEVDGVRVSNYDGYDPRLPQHAETIEVEYSNHPTVAAATDSIWTHLAEATGRSVQSLCDEARGANARRIAEAIASAAFEATNSPWRPEGMAGQVRDKIEATGYDGRGFHYSLSVGDTVAVNGVTVTLARFGFEVVTTPEKVMV